MNYLSLNCKCLCCCLLDYTFGRCLWPWIKIVFKFELGTFTDVSIMSEWVKHGYWRNWWNKCSFSSADVCSVKKCHRLTLSLRCHHTSHRCPMIPSPSALFLHLSLTFNMLTYPAQELPKDQTHPVTPQQPWRKTIENHVKQGCSLCPVRDQRARGLTSDTIALLSMFLKELLW